MAKILPNWVVSKIQKKDLSWLMTKPLEYSISLLGASLQSIRGGDYQKGGFYAVGAGLLAGRHYAKRPEEAMKVMSMATSFMSFAVANENIPQQTAAAAAGFGGARGAQGWISEKIRILMREGYPPPQAKAIAYNMARKRGLDVPKKGVAGDPGRLSRVAALLQMIQSA